MLIRVLRRSVPVNVTYSRNFDGTSHSAINSFNNGQSERIYHHASQQRYLCYAIKYIGSGVPENRAEEYNLQVTVCKNPNGRVEPLQENTVTPY